VSQTVLALTLNYFQKYIVPRYDLLI